MWTNVCILFRSTPVTFPIHVMRVCPVYGRSNIIVLHRVMHICPLQLTCDPPYNVRWGITSYLYYVHFPRKQGQDKCMCVHMRRQTQTLKHCTKRYGHSLYMVWMQILETPIQIMYGIQLPSNYLPYNYTRNPGVLQSPCEALSLNMSAKTLIDRFHKSHNVLDKYPQMHHFVIEMCTYGHIFFNQNAHPCTFSWKKMAHCGLWGWCVVVFVRRVNSDEYVHCIYMYALFKHQDLRSAIVPNN